ncbi:MAG: hypothetical protein KA914_06550 [Ottowia sp.]|nr:hypothetical protein [Ottowia sp.]
MTQAHVHRPGASAGQLLAITATAWQVALPVPLEGWYAGTVVATPPTQRFLAHSW